MRLPLTGYNRYLYYLSRGFTSTVPEEAETGDLEDIAHPVADRVLPRKNPSGGWRWGPEIAPYQSAAIARLQTFDVVGQTEHFDIFMASESDFFWCLR